MDSGSTARLSREPVAVDKQTVIRMNLDTLYSSAVFDLDAGPVTLIMPDPGKRFMSLMIVNEDHYVPSVTYEAGPHLFTKDMIGTRYMTAAVRTLVDSADPKDVAQVHALQDGIKVSQKDPGKFETPNWDLASQKKVRDALLFLSSTASSFNAFGPKAQVDPIAHLLGTAAGWDGNPDKDASYLAVTPANNDGTTVYKLSVNNVPVDAFWSVSVYNVEGFFQKNPLTRIRSITLPPRSKPTAQSPSSSAAATVTFRTACPSQAAGTTRCGSIARAPKSSKANGNFRSRRR